MVDYQSKFRLYSQGYTAIVPRTAVPSMRELYHESGRQLFPERKDRPVHDCRADVAKRITQPQGWDAWLLSHGLQATYSEVMGCYQKNAEHSNNKKSPDKLLFCVGQQGSVAGEFNYPRSACATLDCDILVVDSLNHRVQVFNQFGVFKYLFGKFGTGNGEFNEPTGVVELQNGDIAVADRRNQRIQLYTKEGKYLSQFRTAFQPFSIACDYKKNLVVSTLARTVELYADLVLVTTFPVPCLHPQNSRETSRAKNSPLYVAVSLRKEIIVSDPEDALIKVFDFHGVLLRHFSPQVPDTNLVCSPAGIHVTALDQVLVTDTLNHVVTVFTTSGLYQKTVATAADEVGSLNSVSVGPEGHMVVTECSLTGPHCLKIFRFRSCPCHDIKMPK